MKLIKAIIFTGILALFLNFPVLAQQNGSIGGQVQDTLGAVIVGATVTVVSSTGAEKTATSNQRGEFTVNGLAPGKYTVKVFATNFALYENTEVEVTAGKKEELIVPLTVEAVQEEVEVSNEGNVSTEAENNASATVLKGKDLDALPDDPEELEAALQALAGPSAGPNGGQIYIDGFTGGRLPPKEAIREIRINQNPFSAEFDRLGFGRIEILTRPGSDKYRGSAFFNFNDESLNSRNPFALNRAPSQTRFFGGNFSGPVQKGKSSFFVDISNRDVDSNAVINALVLDQNLNAVPFIQDVQVPTRRFSFSPRFDYQLNKNNTLVARYSFTQARSEDQGIGNLTLPSRAFETEQLEHEFRLTETMIINAKTINETRFQYEWEKREQTGDNSVPTLNVGSAFIGGGSQIGLSFNRSQSWELQNYTTTSLGKNSEHAIKFGVRLRGITYRDRSENNYGGNFSFRDLFQYREAILDNAFPIQFSITTGVPEQKVSQTDLGLFITDDWRVNPGLTLSFGLRYENQTNISDNMNFAPRLAFAWSPGAGGARAPKTVIRGGVGWFYDRFSDNYTLQAERFNGTNQLNLVVSSTDPDPVRRVAAIALLQQPVFTLNGITNVPTADQILAALPQSSTIRQIDPNIQVPYTFQGVFGIERQLPARTTLSVFYIGSRTLHSLRSRNINAPICPLQVDCLNAPRPFPTLGNIYEFEASGRQNQHSINVNLRATINPKISLWGNYRLGFVNGDTDGGFPAYSYDLSDEFSRSSFDSRHNVNFGGNFSLPWQISLSPFVTAFTGRPFNITRGVDPNGDQQFTERPTFGELASRCGLLGLTASYCDISGNDPNAIIPRNYAQGPNFFNVSMRIGKNFGFGGSGSNAAQAQGQGNRETAGAAAGTPGAGGRGPGGPGGGPGGGGPGGGGGGRGPGGGFGGFGGGGGEVRKPYNLNVGLFINNLFNTTNFANPIGNISSSRFGQSTSTAGGFGGFGGFGGSGSANRRVELQMRFSW